MRIVAIIGLMFLSLTAKNSTDCAIFLSALSICIAMPEKRKTP